MIRILIISLTILSASWGFSQKVIDTLDTSEGRMFIYADRTWAYEHDINFNGVMNPQLDQLVRESNLNFVSKWDVESCYSSGLGINADLIKDTIWMCLEDFESDSLDNTFRMPCDGIVTSHYGWRHGRNHNGTDIDLNTGDTVRAAWGGKVRYAKYNDGGFGNLVIVRHHNGLETFYAHLDKHLVVPNQVVEAGEVLGLGGNTGHSYGSHLHFEVRFYDIPMDPEKIIDFKIGEVRDENLLVHRGLFKPGSSTATPASTTPTTTPVANTNKYYRVRSGDTLSGIAAKNRTTVSKLCQLNGIRPTTVLQIGRSLRVH